jgi:ribosome-associated protein
LSRSTAEASQALAKQAVDAALTKNAMEPVLLDVSALATYTDYLLLLSGRNLRQVEAIAEAVQQGMKAAGHDAISMEGNRGGQWMLIDYGDVVVHVFYHPIREYYDLEGLWVDAERVELDVPAELRVANLYS